MNLLHHWICRSGSWRRAVETRLLPWALEGLDLAGDVLEIGPGYGAATKCLRAGPARLICVEIDGDLARALSRRMARTNVTVIQADAVRLPFGDESFNAAVCLTMLHHLPVTELQDRLFQEEARVLRPGGLWAGVDSLASPLFRMIHVGDPIAPIDPQSLPRRLRGAGFDGIGVDVRGPAFRFRGYRNE